MKFVMYPSIDTGEMLITGDFTYKDSCIVIFDIVNEKDKFEFYKEDIKSQLLNEEILKIFKENDPL